LLTYASERYAGVVSWYRRTLDPSGYRNTNPSAWNVLHAEAGEVGDEAPRTALDPPEHPVAATTRSDREINVRRMRPSTLAATAQFHVAVGYGQVESLLVDHAVPTVPGPFGRSRLRARSAPADK